MYDNLIWLKGATKLYFTHYSCVVIILFSTRLYQSVFSTYSFGKLVFCLSALFMFSACSEFDVTVLNFYDICIIIIYIVGVRYSVLLFSLITYHLYSLWEQTGIISRHKNLITTLNKNPCLQGAFEFEKFYL